METIEQINEQLFRAFGANYRGLEMPTQFRTSRTLPALSPALRGYLEHPRR